MNEPEQTTRITFEHRDGEPRVIVSGPHRDPILVPKDTADRFFDAAEAYLLAVKP